MNTQQQNFQYGQGQQQNVAVPTPLRNSGKKPSKVKKLAGIFALSPKSREVAVQEYNQSGSSLNLASGGRGGMIQNSSSPDNVNDDASVKSNYFIRNASNATANNSVYSEGIRSEYNSNEGSGLYSRSTTVVDNRANISPAIRYQNQEEQVQDIGPVTSDKRIMRQNYPYIKEDGSTVTQEMIMQEVVLQPKTEEAGGAFECSVEGLIGAICGDASDENFNQAPIERDDATIATGISEYGVETTGREHREEIPASPSNRSGSNPRRSSPLKFLNRNRNRLNNSEVTKHDFVNKSGTSQNGSRPNLQIDTSRSPHGMDDLPITSASRIEYSENQEYAMVAGLTYSPRSGGDVQSGITPRYRRNAFDNFYDIRPQYASASGGRLGVLPQQNNLTGVQDVDPVNPVIVDHDSEMRNFAVALSPRWAQNDLMTPSIARRIRDFQFARDKRRQRYGKERPVGILGLYDYLAGIRIDVEWAEDAAWRRVYGRPYLSWADFEIMKNNGFDQPFFTYFLVFMSSLMLIVSIGSNNWAVESLTTNPMIGPSVETLLKLGAKDSNLIVNEGEGWRLLAPMVLHAGFIHYAVNMLALWFIGSAVERIHGCTAAAIIFMISAIGGTIMSAVFLPEYVTVGASGGIFGLIGACLADISMNWNILFGKYLNKEETTQLNHAKVLAWLTLDIFVNCIIGLTPFVDNFTHMGGMIIGFLCGLSTMERLDREFFGYERNCITKARHVATRFFGLLLSVLLICIFSAILLEGDGVTSPCPNCRYASCVPFPPWAPEEKKWWYCDDCDRVKGSAQRNTQTGYYEQIQLECPDGQNIAVTLVDEAVTSSKALLEADLPYYCRDYCENVYS